MKLVLLAAAAALACGLPAASLAQSTGDWVLSHYQGSAQLYPATVASASGNRVTLNWDDGTTSEVNKSDLRPYNWRVGSNVSCKWEDGKWYAARITRIAGDNTTLDILWSQDGTTSQTNTGRCRSAG